MFRKLQRQWKDLKRGAPGKRFENRYKQRQKERCGLVAKVLYMIAGTALLLAGLVLMPAPGPGIVVVLLGATLLGQESLWAARTLDRIEVALRKALTAALRIWKRASAAVKALIVAAGAGLAAGAGWIAYAVITA